MLMTRTDYFRILAGCNQRQVQVPDNYHGRDGEAGGDDQPLSYRIAEFTFFTGTISLRGENADNRQQRQQHDLHFEGQVTRDADGRQRVIAEFTDHHFCRQKHRKFSEIGCRKG
jgi:hypothetical protein